MLSKTNPKVSICVVTYNHKNYIRECLDSLINQKTDFEFEIIVGDDASQDGTAEIVKEYGEIHPDLIFPVLHNKNIGGTRNYFSVHHRARGVYICHIDGDDLAFSGKLKKQAEFLDRNLDHVVVWHRVEIFNDQRSLRQNSTPRLQDVVDVLNITQSDLLRYGTLGIHSSIMYRRKCILNVENCKTEILDYHASVRFLDKGKAAVLPDVLGGYRYNKQKNTASKTGQRLKSSPIRYLYLSDLKTFSGDYDYARNDLFINAFINFLVDIKNIRPTALGFLFLAFRLFSPSEFLKIIPEIKKANRLKLL